MVIFANSEGAELVAAAGTVCSVFWADVVAISVVFVDVVTSWETIIVFDFPNGEFVEMNSSFGNFGELVQQISETFGLTDQWLESIKEKREVGATVLEWESSN